MCPAAPAPSAPTDFPPQEDSPALCELTQGTDWREREIPLGKIWTHCALQSEQDGSASKNQELGSIWQKLKHFFRTFGFHSRTLLHWENIDQLCPTDAVGLEEEKPLGAPRCSLLPWLWEGPGKAPGSPSHLGLRSLAGKEYSTGSGGTRSGVQAEPKLSSAQERRWLFWPLSFAPGENRGTLLGILLVRNHKLQFYYQWLCACEGERRRCWAQESITTLL